MYGSRPTAAGTTFRVAAPASVGVEFASVAGCGVVRPCQFVLVILLGVDSRNGKGL